ncbi:ATP synthase F1 subunit delta [Flavobacterium sp. JP2137]|uniref:ATP synthase F1 subunit delta n=1 Tax=Flavobacterium sp. JP2137 TaxID=3414510 RepID=UPI003D2FDA84
MIGTRAAARYAKAMLEISVEKGTLETINKDMVFISDAISQSEDLKVFLLNPIIKGEAKFNALSEVFATTSAQTIELFKLLMHNKRFDILEAIAAKFQEMYDLELGIQKAKVTTAIAMDEAMEAKVLEKIKQISTKKVSIENIVDPSILGGFILRIGDQQYNASLANKLQDLKRQLTN